MTAPDTHPPADDRGPSGAPLRVEYQPGAVAINIVGEHGSVAEVYAFRKADEPRARALAHLLAAAPLLAEAALAVQTVYLEISAMLDMETGLSSNVWHDAMDKLDAALAAAQAPGAATEAAP